jgi:biopolymer transport protein TolR
MAISARRSRHDRFSEINVTPMADIMIVLLIIFMIVAPILDKSPVPLPAAVNGSDEAHILRVVIYRSGRATVEGAEAPDVLALRSLAAERLAATPGTTVLLQVDQGTRYATVSQAMQALRDAGADELALAVDRRLGAGGTS